MQNLAPKFLYFKKSQTVDTGSGGDFFSAPFFIYTVEDGEDLRDIRRSDQTDAGLLEVSKALEIAGQMTPHLENPARLALEVQRQLEMALRQRHTVVHAHRRQKFARIEVMAYLTENPWMAE